MTNKNVYEIHFPGIQGIYLNFPRLDLDSIQNKYIIEIKRINNYIRSSNVNAVEAFFYKYELLL